MADNYKFPDEIDQESQKTDISIEYEGDNELKIEIEDDTPLEDRDRQPMPKEIVEKLDKEELESYSKDVREKFKQAKKIYHDERREKEAAFRERQEAVAAAQQLLEENKRIRSMLNNGKEEYLSAVKNSTEMQLDNARRAYKEAYDSGDTDALLESQEAITRITMQMDRVNNMKVPPLQEENYAVQQQQAQRPDSKALAWQERNAWFGQDEEMTAAALGLHEKLKRNGVAVGSDEYYSVLDKTMRKRFSENFNEPEKEETPTKKSSVVVAPATRSTSSKKVRLSQTQAAFIKKLGITPEQYVREVLKLEN
jgi:hypothetical protein